MPIRLPHNFPAGQQLEHEGIDTIIYERAQAQEIRPLKVVLLNLMPNKIDTETQLLRLISSTSIQIEVTFLKVSSHKHKHDAQHLEAFYQEFENIKDQRFDAIIITGAAVDKISYEEVDYWNEFQEIVTWANDNVFAELFICWGAQAALNVDFGIRKKEFDFKLFGVYPHTVPKPNRLTRGFDDLFYIPQSRWNGLKKTDVDKVVSEGKLVELAENELVGSTILATPHLHKVYMLGHLEYTQNTLKDEYLRDLNSGANELLPYNYFPNDNPNNEPTVSWRATANLFFANWIDYVYQETPYDLNTLQPCEF
jgi:homoserine O-succinyltransferase